MSQNNINFNNVSIYKLDASTNNKWAILPTVYTGQDSSFYYYNTSVTSFSFFAIGGTVSAAVLQTNPTNTSNNNNTVQQNQPSGPGNPNLTWLWIVVGILVLIVGIYFIRNMRKHSRKKKWGY